MKQQSHRLVYRMIGTLTIGIVLAVTSPDFLSAQVPATISYQAQIEGVSGPVDLVFRLYSSDVGGTVLWSEQHRDVPLAGTGFVKIN